MSQTALGFTFDATQVEPNTRPPALPDGWYRGMITEGQIKPTKDNATTNHFLAELGIKVLEPAQYAGRMVYDRLNLWNSNPQAAEIAQKTLSSICHAVGVFQVADLQQLFGHPFQFRAKYKAAAGDYDEGNDVKGYAKDGEKPLGPGGNGGAAAPVAAVVPGAVNGAAPTFSPPWAGNGAPAPAPATPAPAAPAPAPAPAAPPAAPAPPAPPAAPPAPAPPGPPQPAGVGGHAPIAPPWAQK